MAMRTATTCNFGYNFIGTELILIILVHRMTKCLIRGTLQRPTVQFEIRQLTWNWKHAHLFVWGNSAYSDLLLLSACINYFAYLPGWRIEKEAGVQTLPLP